MTGPKEKETRISSNLQILQVGKEFQTTESKDETESVSKVPEDSKENVDEEEKSDIPEKQEPCPRPKRKATIRRPEKSRRIHFKYSSDDAWQNAIVKNVGQNSGTNQFKCTLLLDNSDELLIDFSEGNIVWEYEKFPCNKCDKTFETRRSLRMHIS